MNGVLTTSFEVPNKPILNPAILYTNLNLKKARPPLRSTDFNQDAVEDAEYDSKEQYEIPFIVWVSDDAIKLKTNPLLSQHHVFHSVLHFLSLSSPIYEEKMNIFEN